MGRSKARRERDRKEQKAKNVIASEALKRMEKKDGYS